MRCFKSFLSDQSGATAIEYGLIATLIAVAIIYPLQWTGGDMKNMFSYLSGNIHG